ncbi:bifunctional metallophosphatase/5'-nucleotidase [Mesobacillus boroniphilus]|uniref:5'-nucleotidase n=1 Tax=Mesobacillus boroniphilus JCM 21738 TaxID=1294265 RepID=W4RIZ7_9BACI|nr:5'-nucleotidase C-terminal domain-containing protein [Mesobacillus boroniphilus]GAE44112.1 5'-nucleotidase [Mesobacillus boroniphilus JCM 21738]
MVKELKAQGVDMIIAVSHLGIDESSTDTSIKVAKGALGIDLIVDGHSHSTLVEGLNGENDTLIVSAGEYTKNLGVVELTFEGNKLVDKKAKLVTKEETANIQPDAAVEKVINDIKESQKAILSEEIGKTDVTLDGERDQVRAGETNLGNLITDAMIDVSGAEIAITNGGGIRASIQKGTITKGDVITVLPFGNYIVTKMLTGSQIKEALENGVSAYPETKGAFPHISGMTFAIDTTQPAGMRFIL